MKRLIILLMMVACRRECPPQEDRKEAKPVIDTLKVPIPTPLIPILVLLLLPALLFSQVRPFMRNVTPVEEPLPNLRILFDLGANAVAGSNGNGPVDGVRTPNNSAGTTGVDANGRYWNNREDFREGTWVTDPVDTAGNVVTGFTISATTTGAFVGPVTPAPRGMYNANSSTGAADYSVNTGGQVITVGDYVSTSVRDNCYLYTGYQTDLTITIPAGYQAEFKIWGNRNDNTQDRIMQAKLSSDAWTAPAMKEMNARMNADYDHAIVFTGLTGTVIINERVKSGSTFTHQSIFDVKLTPIP